MSNLDDKLEEILRGIECYQWPEDDEPTIDAVSLHQAKQAIKDCFKEWVVEVIGEDETIRWDDWKDNVAVAEARNDLRAEQRKRMEGQNG